MCNQCNCHNNNGCGCGDNRWGNGCNHSQNRRQDPFCEVENIARRVQRRRMQENRCANEFIRCMRNINTY